MLFFSSVRKRFARVETICDRLCLGVWKRIDENRELLQLLQQEAPEFLARHQWVEGWIERQDTFLTTLAQTVGTKNRNASPYRAYPRPWTGARPIERVTVIETRDGRHEFHTDWPDLPVLASEPVHCVQMGATRKGMGETSPDQRP